MGWCSGTRIFDGVVAGIVGEKVNEDPKELLKYLINELEDMDWDCHQDSEYWDHPLVQEVLMELHPEWFEDEE